MTESARAEQLIDTFATLADTLVEGYDVVDLLQTLVDSCLALLDISAAGILLADARGQLDVLASTNEGIALAEMMHLDGAAGPCAESFAAGIVVETATLDDGPESWQVFRESAQSLGFSSTIAIPMRLRDTTIGVLNFFRIEPGRLLPSEIRAGQALADVATIGIIHERALRESSVVQQHLTHALNSRIVIEQAKGVLSQTHGVTMDEAFTRLRTYARNERVKLSEVAQQVVSRSLTL